MRDTGRRRLTLFAQMASLITLALIAAHTLGYFLILDQQERIALIAASEPGLDQFVRVARAVNASRNQERAPSVLAAKSDRDHHYSFSSKSRVSELKVARRRDLEKRLANTFRQAGIKVDEFEASVESRPPLPYGFPPSRTMFPPLEPRVGPPNLPSGYGLGPPPMPGSDRRWATLSVKLKDGVWLNVDTSWRVPATNFFPRVIAAELLLFLTILAATLFVAHRLAQPLKILSAAAARVGAPNAHEVLEGVGPSEVRRVIDAFNTMSARVANLLHEKDELIGAIAHDLRTPLAALRVRVESTPDSIERGKLVAIIDDMRQLLDDSLEMARLGQSLDEPRLVEVNALVGSLVEDYREQGMPAVFQDGERTPILCRPALTRRLLRNLIDNAIKFGAQANVSIERAAGKVTIVVHDRGPGIPDAELSQVLLPFVRGEASRNRNTGGAGLGLAIAARIAALEGASLQITNALAGGLRAEVAFTSQGASLSEGGLAIEARP